MATARTFGRKGSAGGGILPPPAARFGAAAKAPTVPNASASESRRAAFLASERARAAEAARAETLPEISAAEVEAVIVGEPPAPPPPTDRSLKLAWPIWFFLGLAGGHRFYLRRPISGALQSALFLGFAGATLMQYYWAFAGLLISWGWYVADGLRLRKLHLHSGR